MRYLAIDLGDKRTGLAMGDRETGLISPLEVIECPVSADSGRLLLARIAAAIEAHLGDPSPGAKQAPSLVVGLPINMDGSEGPQAKKAREFGALLAAKVGRLVAYQDERLTSADADWSMARSGLTRGQKKQKRDGLAAAAILRDYFGSLGTDGAGGASGDAGSAG